MDSLPAPRIPNLERAIAGLVAVTLAAAVFGLGGYAAETVAVASVGVAISLGLVVLSGTRRGWHPAVAWLVPFLVYGAANVLWVAPMPWRGWQDWVGCALMAAMFVVVLHGVRSREGRLALLAAILLIGLGAVAVGSWQRFLAPEWLPLGRTQDTQFLGRASAPFGNPNSLAGLLVLLVPPCVGLALRRGASAHERVVAAWLALVFLAGLALTLSRGGWLALSLALAVWPVWRGGSRFRGRGVLVGFLVLVAMAAVTWGLVRSSPQAKQRAVALWDDVGERSRPMMWRAAWANFRAHPWVGTGAGSYDVRFELHRPETEQKRPVWAHNDYLNTLSDYGGIGLLLLAVAVGGVTWQARRERGRIGREAAPRERRPWDPLRSSLVQQGIGVGLAAFALHAAVDFHLKLPGLAMLAAAMAALAMPIPPAVSEISTGLPVGRRARRWALAAAVWAVTGAIIVPRQVAEAIRFPARERLDGLAQRTESPERQLQLIAAARAAFDQAVALDPRNGAAWADRAYAATLLGHHRVEDQVALGRAAETDARAALALSREVPEFWMRLGVALDMQGRWLEAGDAFVEALRRAPANAAVWYHHAYHLSLRPVTQPLARAGIATSLRLDPANRDAEALRWRLPAGK